MIFKRQKYLPTYLLPLPLGLTRMKFSKRVFGMDTLGCVRRLSRIQVRFRGYRSVGRFTVLGGGNYCVPSKEAQKGRSPGLVEGLLGTWHSPARRHRHEGIWHWQPEEDTGNQIVDGQPASLFMWEKGHSFQGPSRWARIQLDNSCYSLQSERSWGWLGPATYTIKRRRVLFF